MSNILTILRNFREPSPIPIFLTFSQFPLLSQKYKDINTPGKKEKCGKAMEESIWTQNGKMGHPLDNSVKLIYTTVYAIKS